MRIKKNILSFGIRNGQGFEIKNLSVPCEFKFPTRSIKQQIYFTIDNDEINIDLIYYDIKKLRQFKLEDSELLSKNCLFKMSVEFSFDIVNHPYANNILIGAIPSLPKEYGEICFGTLKKVKNQFFFMIFAKKGTTDFEDDVVYIHGIWKVELPEHFKTKLFGTINKPV